MPAHWVTSSQRSFVVTHGEDTIVDIPIQRLSEAWKSGPCAERYRGVPDGQTRGTYVPEHSLARAGRIHGSHVTSSVHTRSIGKPPVLVLTGPGINCDRETVEALRLAGAAPETVHVNRLVADRRLVDFRMLVLPGGFSFGDHLGAGTMLATIIRRHVLPDLIDFVRSGRPVLGICNGMQVLSRLGLLGPISLARNEHGRFECRWVTLEAQAKDCPFLRDLGEVQLPIAHGEGRVVVVERDLPEVTGRATLRYKRNPNGSVADIAGICGPEGAVLGLMPHPERYVHRLQHPWRAGKVPDGLAIFRNAVQIARHEI